MTSTGRESLVRVPAPGTYVVDPRRSTIAFRTRHLFGLGAVTGTFTLASARILVADPPEQSTVQAAVDAATFNTGTPGRDKAVRSNAFLATDSWPAITFTSSSIRRTTDQWLVNGTLTVRDKNAPAQFVVTACDIDGDDLVITAQARIDRYAYGITAMKGMAGRHLHLQVTLTASPQALTSPPAQATSPAAPSQRRKEQLVSEPANIAVIYYSSTGTVHQLAQSISTGAEEAGAKVKLLKVTELAPEAAIASNPAWAQHAAATQDVPVATPEDVQWADAVIFGSPTRFGNVASQLKQFIDTLGGLWAQGLLANKVYSGFTASATAHGGQESTLLAYNSIHHFGGLVVAPGYTDPIKFADGNPYGTSHVNGQGALPVDDTARNAASYQGKRVTVLTSALKAGLTD